MKRSISMMMGKGSVSHNSRAFHADNTCPERSHLNKLYTSEPIREVYQKLFGEATVRYNEKQTRADRRIEDYYGKIRTGKQEKLFHEVIFQIGNKDDMGVDKSEGEKAVAILDEFAAGFQERNPNLYLFGAYLHMDEATPHLHLDFVPYTTGSKRGLDTRVSLKAALATQGFTGSGRQETEWSKWVLAEKENLAKVMERHGIEWEKLGTTNEHLSVLNFKKEQRAKEVVVLEKEIGSSERELNKLAQSKQEIKSEIADADKKLADITKRLDKIAKQENLIGLNVRRYDEEPEWQLSEPSALMTAKAYKAKVVAPLIAKFKRAIGSITKQYLELKSTVGKLQSALFREREYVETLTDRLVEATEANKRLKETVRDFGKVKDAIGQERVEDILLKSKKQDVTNKRVDHIRKAMER